MNQLLLSILPMFGIFQPKIANFVLILNSNVLKNSKISTSIGKLLPFFHVTFFHQGMLCFHKFKANFLVLVVMVGSYSSLLTEFFDAREHIFFIISINSNFNLTLDDGRSLHRIQSHSFTILIFFFCNQLMLTSFNTLKELSSNEHPKLHCCALSLCKL